jgi:hypothetical protein
VIGFSSWTRTSTGGAGLQATPHASTTASPWTVPVALLRTRSPRPASHGAVFVVAVHRFGSGAMALVCPGELQIELLDLQARS